MENYISKWKASEIDELLGKAIDKTVVEKGDGALELKIILKDGSSVTLPVQLGSGLSVDNDGTISVNDTFQFGGIVSGVSVETSSTQATSGTIVFDTELNVFLLRSGLKYYMGWNSLSEYLVSSAEWEKRKTTSGSKFYIDNEDDTMTWFVSNGSSLLKMNTPAYIADLGNFSSVSAGLSAAGAKDLASNLAVRLITFSVPSLNESVNILQQHFGSICTQMALAEGKTRTSYLRSIILGGNYSVGNLQQLHLYTKMRVENGMLVGYTADGVDSPNCKRTEICSLTEAAATASTDETETTE